MSAGHGEPGPETSGFLSTERLALKLLSDLPGGAMILQVGHASKELTHEWLGQGCRVVARVEHEQQAEALRGLSGFTCDVGPLDPLPYDDHAFDAVVALDLIPRFGDWPRLITELCRVVRGPVLVDLGPLRWRGRLDTGTDSPLSLVEISRVFEHAGFRISARESGHLLPDTLHRWLHSRALSSALELPARVTGLTRWFGAPMVLRAERHRIHVKNPIQHEALSLASLSRSAAPEA